MNTPLTRHDIILLFDVAQRDLCNMCENPEMSNNRLYLTGYGDAIKYMAFLLDLNPNDYGASFLD